LRSIRPTGSIAIRRLIFILGGAQRAGAIVSEL
jgi:hypothetical protein